jgi:hypothetical protein
MTDADHKATTEQFKEKSTPLMQQKLQNGLLQQELSRLNVNELAADAPSRCFVLPRSAFLVFKTSELDGAPAP